METTKTERLLREAQAIAQGVTGRTDVSDDLLCTIFRSLELEMELAADDLPGASDEDQHETLH